VTDTYDYDAFGNLISSTGSTPNNYLFAGEQFDPALGIYYNRARYYDQRQGRFWSMDTWEGSSGSPISLHKYLYASINPINRIDRNGHEDADLSSFSLGVGVNATVQGIALVSRTVVMQFVGRALILGAALASRVLSTPNLEEEIQQGGEEAIAVVQKGFFEFEGTITEAEAEASSIWNSFFIDERRPESSFYKWH
jgi:RHS repeat-associated protein